MIKPTCFLTPGFCFFLNQVSVLKVSCWDCVWRYWARSVSVPSGKRCILIAIMVLYIPLYQEIPEKAHFTPVLQVWKWKQMTFLKFPKRQGRGLGRQRGLHASSLPWAQGPASNQDLLPPSEMGLPISTSYIYWISGVQVNTDHVRRWWKEEARSSDKHLGTQHHLCLHNCPQVDVQPQTPFPVATPSWTFLYRWSFRVA